MWCRFLGTICVAESWDNLCELIILHFSECHICMSIQHYYKVINATYANISSFGRFEKGSGSNEPERVNPQQHALAVAPLNSMPYIGPPTPPSDVVSTPPEQENDAGETVGPAMIFLPSHSTEEELDNILDATRNNNGVLLTGSAAMGQLGPIVGLVDIWESEDSYVFRVSLPGVSRDESKLY